MKQCHRTVSALWQLVSKSMSKEIWKIVIKVLIYALGLVGAYLGVSAVTSCTLHRSATSQGKAVIVTTDTTVVSHDGSFTFKSR